MCGRYSLSAPPELVRDLFALDETPRLAPRFNIAPTQEAPVVWEEAGRRMLEAMRWGVARPASGGAAPSALLVNARAETAGESRAFAEAFARRRCLVPADGFYEWRQEGGVRQPYRIRRPDERPFALAGLWEPAPQRGAGAGGAFVILTTDANALLASLHDRMPVIVPPASWAAWLGGAADGELAALLRPWPLEDLELYPVSTWVNSAEHEGPECVAPAPAAQPRLFG